MTLRSQSDSPPRLTLLAALRRLRPAFEGRESRIYALAALTLLLLLGENGAQVVLPWLFSRMVARMTPDVAVMALPVGLVGLYALLMLVRASCSSLQEVAYQPISLRLQSAVSEEGLRQVHALSLRFHLERQTGALTRVLDRATDAVDTLLRLCLFNIGPAVLNCGLTLGVIWRIFGGLYALVILAGLLGYAAVARWSTLRRVAARRVRNEASGEVQHRLVDSLLNFEAVRHFGAAGHEASLYRAARRRLETASLKLTRIVALAGILRNAIIASMTGIVLWLAMRDIGAHRQGVADFVLIGTYMRSLYMAVFGLNTVHAGWRTARVDLENWLELLAQPSDVAPPERPVHLPTTLAAAGAADLVFDDVRFHYLPERPVLRGISFAARPGARIGIVGATGSGKTTIGKLMMRAYDPDRGEIRLDGVPLPALDPEDLAALIGVVPQETMLFNDTLAYNIGYGRLGATLDEIEAAARAAELHDFIAALPQGYETVVGERGLKLSGGEKQRVAIARIVLRNPRLLLLDEATSALDTRTERRIQAALDRLARERTTVMIAHRLSTVVGCDEILLLEKGRIVERGGHAALMALGGEYARMWLAQAREAAEAA
ncbi:ATP-binding cassette domain-containing protein [Acidomonas methanolica]|uniref:ATP-binding cassette domain-containing protein n=1 Tax=Acidomonas methanolica TaxID=437 RepID=UPI002119DE1B|nr:ATP-binding cassette domain-containing protein [Acidomonas methanolica]MCQ9154834.1 ABC transporter ATP-binding protein/permease [Acidomonas methanolica]